MKPECAGQGTCFIVILLNSHTKTSNFLPMWHRAMLLFSKPKIKPNQINGRVLYNSNYVTSLMRSIVLENSFLVELKVYVFTSRNEVVAKVIFLHLSVILFTGGGVCLSACWDTTPPEQTHRPCPGEDTPWSRPPRADTPRSLGSRLRHTVNERPVRILLTITTIISIIGKGSNYYISRSRRRAQSCSNFGIITPVLH